MSEYMYRRRKVDVFSETLQGREKDTNKEIDSDDQQKCREKRAKGINMSVAKEAILSRSHINMEVYV